MGFDCVLFLYGLCIDPVQEEIDEDEVDGWQNDIINSSAQTFTLEEVAAATDNFKPESYLGRGGFGKVFKGYLVRMNQVRLISISLLYFTLQ